MALTDNLIALYRLESVCDSSGNARHLTNSNATLDTTTVKLGGGSYDFNGSNNYMQSTATSFDGLPALTVSFWMYVDTKGNYEHVVAKGYGASDANRMAWLFMFDGSLDQKLIFSTSDGTNKAEMVSNAAIAVSTWTHIVGVWDGTWLKMYLNNSLQTDTTTCTSMYDINDTNYPLNLGSRTAVDCFFDGRLDEVAIWSRALTTDEIAWLYNGGTGREIPMGVTFPAVGNVIEAVDRGDGTVGTYHEATVAEVQSGVTFGPSQTYTGTYAGASGGLLQGNKRGNKQ